MFSFIKFNADFTVAETSAPIPFHSAPLEYVPPPPPGQAREGVDPRSCFLLGLYYDAKTKRREVGEEIPEPVKGLPDAWDVSVLQCWVYWLMCAEVVDPVEEEEETQVEQELDMPDVDDEASGSDSAPSDDAPPPAPHAKSSQMIPGTLHGGANEAHINLHAAKPIRLATSPVVSAPPSDARPSGLSPIVSPRMENNSASQNSTKRKEVEVEREEDAMDVDEAASAQPVPRTRSRKAPSDSVAAPIASAPGSVRRAATIILPTVQPSAITSLARVTVSGEKRKRAGQDDVDTEDLDPTETAGPSRTQKASDRAVHTAAIRAGVSRVTETSPRYVGDEG